MALSVHTFAVLGLIAPVQVSAGSMAPHLLGPHWRLECGECGARYEVGTDARRQAGRTECPDCGAVVVIDAAAAPRGGERMYVDRVSFALRSLQRWAPVVFRCPQDAKTLCVKRVVGLPGESVQLLGGDVFTSGELQRKTLPQQLALRVLVHRERDAARRWQPQSDPTGWTWDDKAWHADAPAAATRRPADDWLAFVPRAAALPSDALAYNAGVVTHRNHASDLMLTFRLSATGDGSLWIACGRGLDQNQRSRPLFVEVSPSRQAASIRGAVRAEAVRDAPHAARPRPVPPLEVTVSSFDQQLLVALDGRVVSRRELASPVQLAAQPFAIAADGLAVRLDGLTLWRDVVYTDRPGGPVPAQADAEIWQLGEDEYFVLGDNPAVSHDSRTWRHGPGLAADLIVGRPIGTK